MRGALIGCGFFAQNHLNAWRDMRASGVELVAVCDADMKKADAAAAEFGVAHSYGDAAALLGSESLDFVDIATRMDSHRELVALAARHGVNVIVQKPLAPDWREAVDIVASAKTAGVRLAIHENFRFQAPIAKLKALLEDGAVGRPNWARIAFRTGFDVYRGQPYLHHENRLVILDVGTHVLDVARFFLGDVDHVSCETQKRNAKNIGEDTATMLLRHVSGAVSVVECTYESRRLPDPFPETLIAVEGDRGAVTLAPGLRAEVTRDGETHVLNFSSPLLPWTSQPWHTVQESVLRTQQAIVAAWRAGRDAETSGEDNLKTFALVEAAYEAAAAGRATSPRTP